MHIPHVLRLSGVVKRFGRCRALDGLSLEVPAGVAMGLVGSNGAGKTTSFAVIAGYERLHAGTIDLFGEGPFDPGRHAGRVAVMPQDAIFPSYASVRGVLTYFARLQGISPSHIEKAVSTVLDWVHLSDRAAAQIRTLSHGMRRRVVIAQAFLGEPALVMLDEPMSGLDPREVANMRQLLKERPGSQTIIISSHNLHEIERICDHVAFIRKGKLVRQTKVSDVTGRHHVVSYHIAMDAVVDLAPLGRQMPEAVFEMAHPGKLVCRFAGSTLSLQDVNSRVLAYLIQRHIPVFEVTRGDALESVYIGDNTL